MHAKTTGIRLENLAAQYLEKFGILILHRNFSCRFGEIDIIAKHDSDLVFFEVRFRQSDTFGTAAETINNDKRQKLINAATFYLQSRKWAQKLDSRFDVIAMTKSKDSPEIEWIKDAFNV